MPIKILPPIDQYNSGDDIWVFADLKNSKPLKKVDWYLNFQMYNSDFKSAKPTLISSHQKLPAQAVLSIPFDGDISLWCDTVSEAWKGLKANSLRVFLPDNIKDISKLKFNINLEQINVVLG